MQDCTFLPTCLVSDRPTRQDPFGLIDNLCENLHQDYHSVDSFLSFIKSMFCAPSKPLLLFHNNAKGSTFFIQISALLPVVLHLLVGKSTLCTILRYLLHPTASTTRGNSASLKIKIQEGLQASYAEPLRDTSVMPRQKFSLTEQFLRTHAM